MVFKPVFFGKILGACNVEASIFVFVVFDENTEIISGCKEGRLPLTILVCESHAPPLHLIPEMFEVLTYENRGLVCVAKLP